MGHQLTKSGLPLENQWFRLGGVYEKTMDGQRHWDTGDCVLLTQITLLESSSAALLSWLFKRSHDEMKSSGTLVRLPKSTF